MILNKPIFSPPKLIGHRGVKNLAPENTLDSIYLANKIGLKWVEVDVKISKDFVPILLHDSTLDRTTNGKGLPVDFNYNDLKKLDAGSHFYNYSTKIFIPTLFQVLTYCQNNKIGINIELKPNLGFEKDNIISIVKIFKNFNLSNDYYFSSFDFNSIIMMKKNLPYTNCGLLIDNFDENISLDNVIEISNKYKFISCGLNKDIINLEIIKKLKKNLILTVYSGENLKSDEANQLWSMGIQSIFTDDPTDLKII